MVVGGGLTGLTTAGLLARAGKSVVVIEARHVGAGTTGGSTAKGPSLLQGTHYSRIAGATRPRCCAGTPTRTPRARVDRPLLPSTAWTTSAARRTPMPTAKGARSVRSELDALHRGGWRRPGSTRSRCPSPPPGRSGLDDQLQLDPVELVDAPGRGRPCARRGDRRGLAWSGCTAPAAPGSSREAGDADADTVVIATNMPILDRGGFFARPSRARSHGLAFRTAAEPPSAWMFPQADQPSRSLRDARDADGRQCSWWAAGPQVGASTSGARAPRPDPRLDRRALPRRLGDPAWSAQDYLPHHALPYAGPPPPGRGGILVAGGYPVGPDQRRRRPPRPLGADPRRPPSVGVGVRAVEHARAQRAARRAPDQRRRRGRDDDGVVPQADGRDRGAARAAGLHPPRRRAALERRRESWDCHCTGPGSPPTAASWRAGHPVRPAAPRGTGPAAGR